MKIGLIGYFNAGAYSDDLIEYTTKRVLSSIRPNIEFDSSLLSRCAGGTDPEYLNSFDVIVHAGGSLLGKCTHYPIRDIADWTDRVKTPIAIFGTGYRYEPDKEPLNAEMKQRLQLLFSRAEVISLRGHRTVFYLKQNGIDVSKIHSLGDPVMACDIKLERNPHYIMGNVRNMPVNEVQHSTTENVQRLMAEIYDWLIDHWGVHLKLVSFRHNIDYDNDLKGAEQVKHKMKHGDKVHIVSSNNFIDAFEQMRESAFWFGQRFHPSVFAGIQGIPFVGVEYQFDKMLDWISTVGISNYIHAQYSTLDTFIGAFQKVSENMERLRSVLPVRVKEIHQVAEKIVGLAY